MKKKGTENKKEAKVRNVSDAPLVGIDREPLKLDEVVSVVG